MPQLEAGCPPFRFCESIGSQAKREAPDGVWLLGESPGEDSCIQGAEVMLAWGLSELLWSEDFFLDGT